MDADTIFRQLTTGISFNKRKYRDEAEVFGLVKKSPDFSYHVHKEVKCTNIEQIETYENESPESPTPDNEDSSEVSTDEDFRL